MKQPHFYKAYSRIGLTHAPIRREEPNIGVEDGSSIILSEPFLKEVGEYDMTDFSFTNPEDINPQEYVKTLTEQLTNFKDQINQTIKENQIQIVVGGDNTVTFSSILAVLERVGDVKKIGYIQFDSHGEINSFKGSDSKNFHGMYMRPFFDKFDISIIDELIPSKMDTTQMFIFGDQVLDGDEPEFYEQNNLHSITFEEYLKNKEHINEDLRNFLGKFEYIHVNFDIDVFDASVAGATGIPEDGRWQKNEIFELLTLIKTHSNISFDLSEINPQKEGSDRTVKLAQEILKLIIK